MSAPSTLLRTPVRGKSSGVSRGVILGLGVVVIPILLSIAFNSYGPLTVESAWRMAAAGVAGQTIAILSAGTAVVLTVRRGYALSSIVGFGILALLITTSAIGTIDRVGVTLLSNLERVAQVAALTA